MFNKIILATDFSDHSITARDMAISLTKNSRASLVVLHVYDLKQKLMDEGVLLASELVETAEKKRIRREAEESMSKYCDPLAGMGIGYDTQILQGKAADTIVTTAEQLGADLIIIGSHSKRGFIDVSLGGVTRQVGESAHCPVLIVTKRAKISKPGKAEQKTKQEKTGEVKVEKKEKPKEDKPLETKEETKEEKKEEKVEQPDGTTDDAKEENKDKQTARKKKKRKK